MKMAQGHMGGVILGLVLVMVTGCAAGTFTKDETPGQRFDREMKVFAENCAKAKLKPNDTACDILKLKPADPLATEEGRFAHSIKIPNPVPADSGYKPGMTPEAYFAHLCKAEAGEFIYKTVESVEGIYQMRPRTDPPLGANHLYVWEDPYGGPEGSDEPEYGFAEPSRYKYFESPVLVRKEPAWKKQYRHASYFSEPKVDSQAARYFGYDGHELKTMQKEYAAVRESRYGYTWRGLIRPHDRELGIGGSELIIFDLQTNEVIAVHRGYATFQIDEKAGLARAYWTKKCPPPPNMGGGARSPFILKVLKPALNSQGR